MSRAIRRLLAGVFRRMSVEGSESAEDQQAVRANFGVFVLNGLFFPTAQRVLGPGLLLTWFVSSLTPSAFVIGLIIPIQQGLALLFEPFGAEWLAARSHRSPYYLLQGLLRATLWGVLGVIVWSMGQGQNVLLLVCFFLILGADGIAGGLGNIAFNDTLAQTIPERLRGRARGWRGVLGGMATATIGLLIRFRFSAHSDLATFGLLFIGAGLLFAAGALPFAVIAESNETLLAKPSFKDLLGHVREMLDDLRFRQFVLIQILLMPLVYGLTFFTLFGKRLFGLDIQGVGLLIVVDAITPILANVVWGKLADTRSNLWVMLAATAVGLLAPLSAIALLVLNTSTLAIPVLVLIVFVLGAMVVGVDLSTKNYLLDLASDPSKRPLYIGLNDALVGLPTLLLAGLGAAIDIVGFLPIFIALVAFGTGGIALARRLPSDRQKRQQPKKG